MNDPNKITSDRKREACRINGMKAKGRKTPEGLAISAQNARTHGLTALKPLLSIEDEPAYDSLYDSWLAQICPRNNLERELVCDIVNVQWQTRRLYNSELAGLEMTIAERRELLDQTWESIAPAGRTYDAMEQLANKSKLPSLINRQLNRLTREQDRLIDRVQRLRRDFPPVVDPLPAAEDAPANTPEAEVKNEANPISEHSTNPAAAPAENAFQSPRATHSRLESVLTALPAHYFA